MTLTTFNPFDLQIDRLFEDAVKTMGTGRPACNVWEDADHFYVQMALPGWDAKDINIKVEDGVVTLKGVREEKAPESPRTYFVHELGWPAFARSFTLPANVSDANATAAFKDGVLTVEFAKREEAKPRQITINVQ